VERLRAKKVAAVRHIKTSDPVVISDMPCPWATRKLDTLPPGVTSWDDPIMDPMGCGTARVMLKFETEEKRTRRAA